MIHKKKEIFLCGFLFLWWGGNRAFSQSESRLTLRECYALARRYHPMTQQSDLIAEASEYSLRNIQRGRLPQLKINGQLTYQSAVTEIPIESPNAAFPNLHKDRYKIYAEAKQLLYNDGSIKKQKLVEKANESVNQNQLEVQLYQIKNKVNQLFFGILLLNEQIRQNGLLENDIEIGLDKLQTAIESGTALKTGAYKLKASLLKAQQHTAELESMRKAYREMLRLFIHREVSNQTVLIKPQVPFAASLSNTVNRPELAFYDQQIKRLEMTDDLLDTKVLPQLSLFVQAGYGRPTPNMFSDDFDTYYIGGIRLSWHLSAFYTLKNEKEINKIKQLEIQAQRESFLLQIQQKISNENSTIEKYQKMLHSDDEIIEMQRRIKNTSLTQLTNGVIDANDYLRDVNDENQALQRKSTHEIQLLMTQFEQQTTKGTYNF
ncbi:MAG: TolC family protein [Flavobacteriales bacterium]